MLNLDHAIKTVAEIFNFINWKNLFLHITMWRSKQPCEWLNQSVPLKIFKQIENCLCDSAFLHDITEYLSKLNKRSQRRFIADVRVC